MTCTICGYRRAKVKGRCTSDYHFWHRNGRDRTPDEVMAQFNGKMDRLLRRLETPDEPARTT